MNGRNIGQISIFLLKLFEKQTDALHESPSKKVRLFYLQILLKKDSSSG